MNPANYVLTDLTKPNAVFVITGFSVSPQTSPTAPQTVTITFNRGVHLRGLNYLFRVISGGVSDLAGNALDGEFAGVFPSGNGVAGGDFLARLAQLHNAVYPPLPVTVPPLLPAQQLSAASATGAAPNLAASQMIVAPIAQLPAAASTATQAHDLALAQVEVPRKGKRKHH